MKQAWQQALAASVSLLCSGQIVHAAEWTPVEAELPIERRSSSTAQPMDSVKEQPSTASQQPLWQEVTEDPDHALPAAVVWTPVEPSVATDIEEKIEEEAPIKDPATQRYSISDARGPTHANDKAIWRDDTGIHRSAAWSLLALDLKAPWCLWDVWLGLRPIPSRAMQATNRPQ